MSIKKLTGIYLLIGVLLIVVHIHTNNNIDGFLLILPFGLAILAINKLGGKLIQIYALIMSFFMFLTGIFLAIPIVNAFREEGVFEWQILLSSIWLVLFSVSTTYFSLKPNDEGEYAEDIKISTAKILVRAVILVNILLIALSLWLEMHPPMLYNAPLLPKYTYIIFSIYPLFNVLALLLPNVKNITAKLVRYIVYGFNIFLLLGGMSFGALSVIESGYSGPEFLLTIIIFFPPLIMVAGFYCKYKTDVFLIAANYLSGYIAGLYGKYKVNLDLKIANYVEACQVNGNKVRSIEHKLVKAGISVHVDSSKYPLPYRILVPPHQLELAIEVLGNKNA